MPWFLSSIARLRYATQRHLVAATPHRVDFYVLIGLSAALATLGLLMDNTAVIIGAMVVAPLITPVFRFALHVLLLQVRDAFRSFLTIIFGTFVALLVSMSIGMFASMISDQGFLITNEILSRSKPDVLYFLVAWFSGAAGAFAYARPKIQAFVTGIAIAVAMIPPIAVAGLALSLDHAFLFRQSMLLYIFNVGGICFGSIVMFLCLGFGKEIDTQTPHAS